MTDRYRSTIEIDAPPDRVYRAVTTLDGLAAWWTPQVEGSPTEGGRVSFHFDDQKITMAVAKTEPDRSVRWECLGHSKFPEWSGTSVIFAISGAGEGRTVLHFEHVGLAPACDCFEMCSNGWDHYLRSLSAHASGGAGSPWRRSFSSGTRR